MFAIPGAKAYVSQSCTATLSVSMYFISIMLWDWDAWVRKSNSLDPREGILCLYSNLCPRSKNYRSICMKHQGCIG